MRSRLRKLLWLLLAGALMAGCWDRREIEEKSSVLAVGMDACTDTAGCAWVTSRQIAIPGRIPLGGGTASASGEPVVVITVPAANGPDSQARAQRELNRKLSFGHLRLIIVGEDLARQPLGPILDYVRRIPETRRLLWVAVAEGRAEDVVEAMPTLEPVPALFLSDMIEDAVKTGRLPEIFLGEFLVRFSNKGEEAVAPIIRLAGPDQPELAGLAVFRGDRMVGKLTQEEMMTYLELRGTRRGSELLKLDLGEGRRANMTIYGRGVRYRLQWGQRRLFVNLELELEGELGQLSPSLDSSDPETIRQIEGAAAKEVTRRAEALLKKLQEGYQSDILAVGERVRAFLPSVWQSIDDWPETFAEAHFQFDTQVHVRRTGMAMD